MELTLFTPGASVTFIFEILTRCPDWRQTAPEPVMSILPDPKGRRPPAALTTTRGYLSHVEQLGAGCMLSEGIRELENRNIEFNVDE